jgi:hypothetical protein
VERVEEVVEQAVEGRDGAASCALGSADTNEKC